MNGQLNRKKFGKFILGSAILVTLLLTTVISCRKSDEDNGGKEAKKNGIVPSLREHCVNPYEWVGEDHNIALSAAMATFPLPANVNAAFGLAKDKVSALTNDSAARTTIYAYPQKSLAAGYNLANALIAHDSARIALYCTPAEAMLMKQLVSLIERDQPYEETIENLGDWCCAIQNDESISPDLKDKMLVTGNVMIRSTEYWHQAYGGTPGEERHWIIGDAVGALIGFGFGGGWGALIGAAAGSILVGCFGWEVIIN